MRVGAVPIALAAKTHHATFSQLFFSHPQSKAIDAVVKDINARFGKGSIMFLNAEPEKM